jgi:hypothetical protein
MERKTAVVVLSLALFGSFFFPVFDWNHSEMSGLNYILSDHIPDYKYFLLLVPFSALLLFWGALHDEIYLFNSNFLSCLPLICLLFILVMRYRNPDSENLLSTNETTFSTIDIGFWLILLFSCLLIFGNKKKRTSH